MYSYKTFIAVFLCILTLATCKKDDDLGDPTIPDPSMGLMIDLRGSVVAEDGSLVEGALVEFNGQLRTTDSRGVFRFASVSASSGNNYVEVNMSGFFFNGRIFYVYESGAVSVKIRLLPKVMVGSFTASAGGTITSPDGVSVQFPANGMANGYQGTVNVYSRYIDPTDVQSSLDIPGLDGVNVNGESGLLRSFGMGHIELEDNAGNPLQLATGSPAQLTMPVPSSLLSAAEPTIPSLYFDRTLGLWKEEGTATLQGNSYVGNVSHFSLWNWDHWAMCRVGFRVNISCGGQPLAGHPFTLAVQQGGGTYFITGVTDIGGGFSALLPCLTTADVYVLPSGSSQIEFFLGTLTAGEDTQNLITIDFVQNSICGPYISVTGNVVTQDYVAVNNGYMYLQFDDFYSEPVFFNDQGEFTALHHTFDPDLLGTEAEIIVWNLDDFTTGNGPNVPFDNQLNVLPDPIVIGTPTSLQGRIYCSGTTNYLFYCLDASTGDQIWSKDIGPLDFELSPAYMNNRVYIRKLSGEFFCLNAFDGTTLWSTSAVDANAPYVEEGVVYISNGYGFIKARGEDSGDQIWSYNTGGSGLTSEPTISGNVLYCGKGDTDPGLVALDKSDGTLLWEYLTPDEVNSGPCVHDGKVFFACDDQEFYALNAATGQLAWQATLDDAQYIWSSPTAGNGLVYAQSVNHLYAFNANTGSITWSMDINSSSGGDDPYLSGSRLFVSGGNGDPVYCLNAQTGAVLYLIDDSGTGVGAANQFVEVDNLLFMRHHLSPYTIQARNATTGASIWLSNVQDDFRAPMVVVDENGLAHYTTTSGMQQ